MNELTEQVNDETDLDYLRGVKSSTCLLLPNAASPIPTVMDFKHPLADEIAEDFLDLPGPESALTMPSNEGDSSSSGDANSVIQDPVSAQLINNISMLDYQTLSKVNDIGKTDPIKINGHINLGNKKLPGFVNWNWNIIRKILLWVVVSSLVALTATIVSMIVTLPKSCNPVIPWYQGKVFYEVFPASFEDSDKDGIGDLKGLQNKLDYIENLGVSAIRLNYIFKATQYLENYKDVTSLTNIDKVLGTINDFQALVNDIHIRNMSLVLDIPVISLVKTSILKNQNNSQSFLIPSGDQTQDLDLTTQAIHFWSSGQNVDGFYLKDLEEFVDEPEFEASLKFWKSIIGSYKILIVSENTFKKCKETSLNVLLSRVDLIDVHLDIYENSDMLQKRIEEIIYGTLWNNPAYPWVHWNIGDVDSTRVTSMHREKALSLSFLELALPGTVSIFYGDEIGLSGLLDSEKDFHEHEKVHNLVPMQWVSKKKPSKILPWISDSHFTPQFSYLEVIKHLIEIRSKIPTVYLRGIYKEGKLNPNTKVKFSDGNVTVVERWYPRRNTIVFIANFGETPVEKDMSSMFYGGEVISATNTSLFGENLYFDKIYLAPYSSIIVKLEK